MLLYSLDMNKEKLFAIMFGSIITCLLNAASLSHDVSLHHLYVLAGKNLNYSSSVKDGQILELCAQLEKRAYDMEDYDNMFRIQLMAVNSNCLNGKIGLALSKSQQMYEEAHRLNSDLGKALSVQAIGITYMHSNEVNQAYTTFVEAGELLKKVDDDFSKIRLLIQQLHVCMLLNNMPELRLYLIETRNLLEKAEVPDKNDYIFYLQCYQIYYDLGMRDVEQSRLNLEQIKRLKPSDGVFDRWYYNLASRYYELIGEYEQALLFCDSTALVIMKSGNLSEYKYILIDKASLLEKKGSKREACDMYEEAKILSDSLNMIHYVQQIDSLRIAYWVDQMEIENTAMHNKMLAWIIFSFFIILLLAACLIFAIRKKNRKLEQSRKRLEKLRTETSDSIRSKNLFLSNMSHELRTPLNAIVGFAGLITANEVEDAETRQQCSDLISQNSELLLKLFNDVADLSALKEDNIRFTFGYYDIVLLCHNVIDTVEKVKRTSANVYFETSLDKFELYTDSGRLQQVLINLLINSTKFTPEGSILLKLEIDNEKNEVVFIVQDTGCGIPLDKQPHIFERFEKLHEGVQGAGLGLSICQLIVEHVGGRIWIDASYTDGARFVFTHPLNYEHKQNKI